MTEQTLPNLAKAISEWFPELNGRSFAVSEVDPFNDKTNVATLPLAIVAMLSETNTSSTKNTTSNPMLETVVIVQFMFQTVKYKKHDGSESPFFAYYDYEGVRDRLQVNLRNWKSPRGARAIYQSLDQESDNYGVYLSFKLLVTETWCDRYIEGECKNTPKTDITFRICQDYCIDGNNKKESPL